MASWNLPSEQSLVSLSATSCVVMSVSCPDFWCGFFYASTRTSFKFGNSLQPQCAHHELSKKSAALLLEKKPRQYADRGGRAKMRIERPATVEKYQSAFLEAARGIRPAWRSDERTKSCRMARSPSDAPLRAGCRPPCTPRAEWPAGHVVANSNAPARPRRYIGTARRRGSASRSRFLARCSPENDRNAQMRTDRF